ncbi:aldose epimerase family protein [Roseivirga sp. BDSF3-8]|uniref:aldose epimerase family protein n=1 Tax=Roseivirga sp. BDSF3-8 TaxID=3241598 RepID=UPI0035327CB3
MPEIKISTPGELKGNEVTQWTIRFPGKLEATVMNYGATLMNLKVPDREGTLRSIVLGYDRLEDYVKDNRYFGATVGRYANRIAGGKFTLNETEYTLRTNHGPNTLHGGTEGFDKKIWGLEDIESSEGACTLTFSYHSPDGEEGFPGDLQIRVIYTFTPTSMKVSYQAETKHLTVINPSHHSYFNLSGDRTSAITDHVLTLRGEHYLPVDGTGIPTNGPLRVEGTPFDFTGPKEVGERIDDPALAATKGYDHCWILKEPGTNVVSARLWHPESGRQMEVLTTEPGMQFFSGNFPPSEELYAGGRHFGRYSGLALETQHFPDSPNHPEFPSTILQPGDAFYSETTYRFSVAD